MHVVPRKHVFMFSSNSEDNDSELLENHEQMIVWKLSSKSLVVKGSIEIK